MFYDFARVWTPALFAEEVGAAPHAFTLAGERLVAWRGPDGRATVQVDRCPHRGVKLSLGKVEDGCLVCPFHGWRFDAGGARTHVPFNPMPAERLGAVRLPTLPTRELGGLVWVWTDPEAPPAEEPYVPEELLRDDVAVYRLSEPWETHWTRAMENMLDTPHLPFVHRRTIGAGLRRKLYPEARMAQTVDERPYGWRLGWAVDDEASEASLDWLRPNGMRLNIDFGGRLYKQIVWCVPVEHTRVRMMAMAVRGFQVGNPLARVFDWSNHWIIGEDRAVVESSDPPEVPDAGEEANVPTDRPTLLFRTWYRRHLKGSAAGGGSVSG